MIRQEETMSQQQQSIDLGQLFGTVLRSLQQHREQLNQADDYNHDHGDNMVDTFSVITRSMKQTRGAAHSDQMAYAARSLRQSNSSSAKMYADGLSQASQEYKGRQVTPENAMNLIEMLLGGGQAVPEKPGSRGLGDLLGAMLGGGQQQQQPQYAPQQQSGGLGDLLGAMLGGGQQQQQPPKQDKGIGAGDLMRAALAYMRVKNRGGSNLEAMVSAIVAASAMGSGYREQSSSLVVNALLGAVQGMLGAR